MIEETYQLAYAPEAVADIRSIYAYIAFELGVPATAAKQVNRIRKMIKSLDFMPEKYVLIEKEPWKSKHTHKMSVDSYTVFYKVDKDRRVVTNIRIVYGGRDTDTVLNAVSL